MEAVTVGDVGCFGVFTACDVLCFSVRLLVGAPRAGALTRQASKVTGGLYKCDVTLSNSCDRIDFDNEGEPSVCPSIFASLHSFIHSFVHPSIHLFIYSSIHPLINLFIHPSICSFMHLSIH